MCRIFYVEIVGFTIFSSLPLAEKLCTVGGSLAKKIINGSDSIIFAVISFITEESDAAGVSNEKGTKMEFLHVVGCPIRNNIVRGWSWVSQSRVHADMIAAAIFWTHALKKAFGIPAGCAPWSLEGSPQSLYYRSQMCPLKYI
jgi:hypothetical protein